MTNELNKFYSSVSKDAELTDAERMDIFTYYLTTEVGESLVTPAMMNVCFDTCELTRYSNPATYFARQVDKRRYVKVDGGYKLHRSLKEELDKRIGKRAEVIQSGNKLRALQSQMPSGDAQGFLKETIDCFEAGANRATVVMCWILTLDHMLDFVMKKNLPAFNAALAAHPDKKLKAINVVTRDDFSDIPEKKLIELLRSSGTISNDVRKILDEKLGIRNTSAHPSAVAVKPTKVIEFVDDLIENVVLKYPV